VPVKAHSTSALAFASSLYPAQESLAHLKDFITEKDKELIALVNNAGIDPEGDTILHSGSAKIENVLADPSIESQALETNVL
jgi:hypothetical protein